MAAFSPRSFLDMSRCRSDLLFSKAMPRPAPSLSLMCMLLRLMLRITQVLRCVVGRATELSQIFVPKCEQEGEHKSNIDVWPCKV